MSPDNIVLLGTRVLIAPVTPSRELDSGIVLAADPPEHVGRVIRLGPDVQDVAEGDLVLFGREAGQELQIEDGRYLLADESELLGVLEPEKGDA